MAQTGYTPISIYYSSTASNTPTAGNLVAGELAINTNDGILYYKDSSGVVQKLATKGGVGTSSTTQVLYNSSGLIAGSANLTFNGTTLTTANDASISGLTVGKGGGGATYSTALGKNALAATNTGDYATAVGYSALNSNTSGGSNSAFGFGSLTANTTGSQNSAFGQGALNANTTQSNNTAVGYQAGYSNNNGGDQCFVGYKAGYATTGGGNSFVGSQAGQSNTTGSVNTGFGLQALYSNTTASNNTAVGYQAGYSNTTGTGNIFLGYQAGYATTTPVNNVFIGNAAGGANVTGGYNTFVGNGAGSASNYNGVGVNTFVGYNAGSAITTGIYNTLIGGFSGNGGGLDIRTGSNYIVLSDGAGNPRGIFDGSGNFLVGTTSTSVTSGGIFNRGTSSFGSSIIIGHQTGVATGNSYCEFQYNGGNIGSIIQSGTTAVLYNTTSDYRLKNDVKPITNALATVEALNPVSFTWIDGRPDDGFLAHEIQAVIPNCVTGEKDAVNEDGTPKYQQMDNSGVIPFLVKAIQELKAEVDSLKQQLGK